MIIDMICIRKEYIDDISLARSIARSKYNYMLFNGSRVFRTRMYDSLKEVYDGFTRVFPGKKYGVRWQGRQYNNN